MKKKLFFIFAITMILGSAVCAIAKDTDIKVSNGAFSIYLPKKLESAFSIKKEAKGLFVYDKASKKAGFGGFAFGVKAYKNPSDHAMMPGGRKLGELIDKKSIIYDMVLIQPTDVQYDYIRGEAESYKSLYNLAETVRIEGVKGNKYYKDRGMKGQDLYKEVLEKHIKAVKEKWDSAKLEEEDMSYMYNVISSSNKNPLEKIGYTYYDTNGDGIEELLIGEIAQGDWKGVVYDIYTTVDRKTEHVVSGGSRNRYYVCDGSFICNEYSSGADENGMNVYILIENSTELFSQVGFKYDGYTNKKNPWFISYNIEQNEWENVTEQKFKERKSTFDKYERFDFTPLGEN